MSHKTPNPKSRHPGSIRIDMIFDIRVRKLYMDLKLLFNISDLKFFMPRSTYFPPSTIISRTTNAKLSEKERADPLENRIEMQILFFC